ncbi:MAG: CpXC domain-containing protein [Chloroflexia bacterium]
MARSLSEPVELECARCRKRFVTVVWRIVDAAERPDLRLLILLGRLNRVCCPACGAEGSFPGPFLYHDAAHQAVLLALPSGTLGEAEVREMADPLVEALHRAIPPEERQPYLWNVQLAGSMAGLAAEIRSWGEGGLALPGGAG